MNFEDQLRVVITRQVDRLEVPLPDIDGFEAGAMRRRRRQRMVAAVATCVALGIVASGFVAGQALWDTQGAAPADQPTQESTTTPSTDDRVGIIGPPPPGTPPTGPAAGELVAEVVLYNSGTWVYADGRIINAWRNNGTKSRLQGFVVRQLTPSGVEAMRSFLIDRTSGLANHRGDQAWSLVVRDGGRLKFARDFEGCQAGRQSGEGSCPGFTDPDWLPASAWADPTYRPFVPHSYDVCLDSRRVSPAEALPAEAVDLLMGGDSPLGDRTPARGMLCRELATPAAEELEDVLDDAGPAYVRRDDQHQLSYDLPFGARLDFIVVLPHGGDIFCVCA